MKQQTKKPSNSTFGIISQNFSEEINVPSKIRMVKPRGMIWAAHVALIVEKRTAYMIFVVK
jgi:hypothetical protein